MQEDLISARSILRLIYNYKFSAMLVFALVCAAGGYLFKSQPVRYKTNALLINEGSPQQSASLQSLAMMAGISMASSPSSSAYLADYIKTHDFLLQIAQRKWRAASVGADSITLDSLWKLKIPSYKMPHVSGPEERSELIASQLSSYKYLTFVQEKTGGLYNLTCEFEDPQVSHDVCNLVIELMNDWNSNKRRSNARDTRSFLEKRLAAGKERLARSENAQRQFKENNAINTSPYTQLQEARLNRELQIAQEIYLQLTKQYEIALTDEIKESNALDIMQKPVIPRDPTSPVKRNWLIAIFATALVLAIAWAFIADFAYLLGKEVLGRIKKR